MPVEKLYRGTVVNSADDLTAAPNGDESPPGGGGQGEGTFDVISTKLESHLTSVLTRLVSS